MRRFWSADRLGNWRLSTKDTPKRKVGTDAALLQRCFVWDAVFQTLSGFIDAEICKEEVRANAGLDTFDDSGQTEEASQ